MEYSNLKFLRLSYNSLTFPSRGITKQKQILYLSLIRWEMAAMRDSAIINYSSRGRGGRGAAINGESLPVFLSESSHNNVSTANLCFPSCAPLFSRDFGTLEICRKWGWCNFHNKPNDFHEGSRYYRAISLPNSFLLRWFWLKLKSKRGKERVQGGVRVTCFKGGKFLRYSFLRGIKKNLHATIWRNYKFRIALFSLCDNKWHVFEMFYYASQL